MSDTPSDTPSDATVHQIALDDLHESPFNPRTSFDPEQLRLLAVNIVAEGRIHQPLLVRPRLTNPLRDDLQDGFEIVYGHRRYRAAELARLATVPCIVRAMTDAEVRSAQAAENLQRENLQAFEEAQGYADMMERDGLSADDIALRVGKSKSHVYARVKLLQAVPAVREACMAGEYGAEVALLIARLRTAKLQEKALAAIKADHVDIADGGKKSFREIRLLLADKFTLALKGAIFDPQDATLLPDAGACGECPKRACNAPEFEDVASGIQGRFHMMRAPQPDQCTDPDCFEAKRVAHLARKAAELEAAGKVVINGAKARQAVGATGEVKGDYIPIDKVKATLAKARKDIIKRGQLPPEPVTILDQRSGKAVQAFKRADLVAAGVMSKEAAAAAKKPDHAANAREQEARWERQREKAAEESARRWALLQHVRGLAAGRERTTFELRMVVAAALQGVAWSDRGCLADLYGVKDTRELQDKVDQLDAAGLTTLLLDCILVDNVITGSASDEPGPLLALAEHYGVDAQAVMQAAVQAPAPADEGTPTPSPAGASADPAGAARAAKPVAKRVAAKPVAKKAALRGVRYHDVATGQTWSGKGLQPRWLKVALANGHKLSEFDIVTPAAKKQEVKDDDGCAVERDPNTADMFQAA